MARAKLPAPRPSGSGDRSLAAYFLDQELVDLADVVPHSQSSGAHVADLIIAAYQRVGDGQWDVNYGELSGSLWTNMYAVHKQPAPERACKTPIDSLGAFELEFRRSVIGSMLRHDLLALCT